MYNTYNTTVYILYMLFSGKSILYYISTLVVVVVCLFLYIDATNITIFVKDYIVFEDDGFIEINFEINRPPLHTSEFIVEIHTFDGEAESKVVCIAVCCIYIL